MGGGGEKYGGGGLGAPVFIQQVQQLQLGEMSGLEETRDCFMNTKQTEVRGASYLYLRNGVIPGSSRRGVGVC